MDGHYVVKQHINRALLCDKKLLLNTLDIELTERCNNNCVHCYINRPRDDLDAKKKELSAERIKNILREAQALGCLRVRFTGGEPLLRKDFEELYVFARRIGLKAVIFTNATLITPHFAKLFSYIPPLERIGITVYGMKKISYEGATRTPGSFEAASRGINLLLKRKIPFTVRSAYLPFNKNEISEFEKWAAAISYMNKPPSYSIFLDLRSRRDDPLKDGFIKSIRVSAKEALEIFTRGRRKNKYIKARKEFCARFMRPGGDKLFSCGSGPCSACLDAYGNLQLCILLRHPDTVYDLRRGTLKDALTNFFPKIRKIRATNQEYLRRCAKCFLKGLCEQCPAKSWMEHGTLDTPVEYLCEIAHTQARFLGLLNENEKGWEIKEWERRITRLSE